MSGMGKGRRGEELPPLPQLQPPKLGPPSPAELRPRQLSAPMAGGEEVRASSPERRGTSGQLRGTSGQLRGRQPLEGSVRSPNGQGRQRAGRGPSGSPFAAPAPPDRSIGGSCGPQAPPVLTRPNLKIPSSAMHTPGDAHPKPQHAVGQCSSWTPRYSRTMHDPRGADTTPQDAAGQRNTTQGCSGRAGG